ncbi:MAG: hypothetical protein Fur0044_44830 [Anaerolineae bacterium]
MPLAYFLLTIEWGFAVGSGISLPTERQWEKAARGGLEKGAARIYPWGDEPDPNRANYDDAKIGATSAVGCFPGGASPDGVEDLAGNVWEWCRTRYREPENETLEGGNDVPRVLRGGAFDNDVRLVRCAVRLRFTPSDRDDYLGFRVAWVASPL